jgi:hypothetical protein
VTVTGWCPVISSAGEASVHGYIANKRHITSSRMPHLIRTRSDVDQGEHVQIHFVAVDSTSSNSSRSILASSPLRRAPYTSFLQYGYYDAYNTLRIGTYNF